jgi:hypothetical protein
MTTDSTGWNHAVDVFLDAERLTPAHTAASGYRAQAMRTLREGRWVGCFAQPSMAFRPRWMELSVKLAPSADDGGRHLTGDGRDVVGRFLLSGSADPVSSEVRFEKRYVGAHPVRYAGSVTDGVLRGVWTLPGGEGRGLFAFWHVDGLSRADLDRAERSARTDAWVLEGFAAMALAPVRVITLIRHRRLLKRWRAAHPELAAWSDALIE